MIDPRLVHGVAIVGGGSGALGSEIALELARSGSDIAFTFRRGVDRAERVASEIRAVGRRVLVAPVDLEDPAAVADFIGRVCDSWGTVHSVVYASGPALRLEPIGDITPQRWAEVANADVNGCFNLVRHTLAPLRVSRGAYVAVTTAAVARIPARDSLSAVPKAAVETLMRAVAKEEGRQGIRANCVAPGWIDAGVGASMLRQYASPEAASRIVNAIPLRRIGTAADVASAACFLLSSRAQYISGQTLIVDGGMQV